MKQTIISRVGLLILLLTIIISHAYASPVYYSQTGNYYDVVKVPSLITWNAAKNTAESQSYSGGYGHLATITSQGENNFIVTNLGDGNIKECWIGGIQPPGSEEPAGGWTWVTGEPWSYTNWVSWGADNSNGDDMHPPGYPENALIFWDEWGHWNDVADDIPMNGYIVEFETKNIHATPSPTISQVTSTQLVTTQKAITDTSIHSNPYYASSQSEDIFDNILLIPLIVAIILVFIVGFLFLSRKKKYAASEESSKTIAFKENSSENRSSATYSIVPSLHHDVFISYASQNKTIADAICGTLETNRIRCWIAPRDILPGMNYQESIIDAIDESRIMVLVYSSFTNNSPHITRELTRAVSKNVIIIPFRIEDVPLSKSMEYLISIPHWLDALTPPLEVHLNKLAKDIQSILERIKK